MDVYMIYENIAKSRNACVKKSVMKDMQRNVNNQTTLLVAWCCYGQGRGELGGWKWAK